MSTQRFSLTTVLPSPIDDRDRYVEGHTTDVVVQTVRELLDHAREHSTRLLWATLNVRVERLEVDLPPVVRVTIMGVGQGD